MKIAEIDPNFAPATFNDQAFVFLDGTRPPFELDGLPFFKTNQEAFCRLPIDRLGCFNDILRMLAWHTSGAQLRFRTNATRLVVKAELKPFDIMQNISIFGSFGIDCYLGTGSAKRFVVATGPTASALTQCSGQFLDSATRDVREFTLNLPTYSGVSKIEIGVDPEAEILPPTPFAVPGKVVFYGPSITPGAASCRPGNTYPPMLSRHLDFEPVCLGFGGNARGELDMAQIICEIDPIVFVMDYDHNAPNPDHLQRTHEPFFRYIRERKPKLPVIFMSKPDFDINPVENAVRRNIVRRTFANAVAAGDDRVFFIDGETLFQEDDRDACTVDGCHPNDLGFYRMYQTVRPVMKQALGLALEYND